jgi:hypothetical protein
VLYGPRKDFKDLDVTGAIMSFLDLDKATLVARDTKVLQETTGALCDPFHFAA